MDGKVGGIRPMGMFGSRGSPPPHLGHGAHPGLSPLTPTSEMLHFDLGLKVRSSSCRSVRLSCFSSSDRRGRADLLRVRGHQLGQTLRHPRLQRLLRILQEIRQAAVDLPLSGGQWSLHYRQGTQEPVPGLQTEEMPQHGDEQRR